MKTETKLLPFDVLRDSVEYNSRCIDSPDGSCDLCPHKNQLHPAPRIIALIGSARFVDQFMKLEKEITMDRGECVLLPYVDGLLHKNDYTDEEWEYLMGYSFRKIDLADVVLVLNIDGYIGEHTRREIEYTNKIHKRVEYLEPNTE